MYLSNEAHVPPALLWLVNAHRVAEPCIEITRAIEDECAAAVAQVVHALRAPRSIDQDAEDRGGVEIAVAIGHQSREVAASIRLAQQLEGLRVVLVNRLITWVSGRHAEVTLQIDASPLPAE